MLKVVKENDYQHSVLSIRISIGNTLKRVQMRNRTSAMKELVQQI